MLTLSLGAAYIIDRELDVGGSSRVFVAHEESHDQDVVVTVLSPKFTEGLSAERFEREMRRAAGLDEPHTIPVLTVSQTANGLFYYSMPYVRGDTLRERIDAGPIGFDDSVALLRDVARSLAYAHGQGIVHRNIKPDKVILFKTGAALSDFGIASAIELSRTEAFDPTHTLLGDTLDTAAYMAPELATNDPSADHRADIYSWGVMAYELLSEAHPFADLTSDEALVSAHLTEIPAPLPYKRYGIPEQLAVLVMRCLEKDPAARPASASELLTVLDRIPLGASSLAIDSAGTARWIGASILAGLVLFVASATAVYRMQSREGAVPPLVVVMPFESTGAVGDSLFAEGLGDALTSRLAQLDGLRIIDRRSARSAARTGSGLQAAGQALGAEYVVHATMRWIRDAKGSSRVEIVPVLMTVATGTMKWTGLPESSSLADPFTTHVNLAINVAKALGVKLDSSALTMLAIRSTQDTGAFAAFTRGNRLYRQNLSQVEPDFSAALREFEHAYARDPRYADALAGAAAVLVRRAEPTANRVLYDSAIVLSRRALAIARGHPRALIALSLEALTRDDPEDAQLWVERAFRAHPSDIEALELRAAILPVVGDSAGTWRDVERLAELGPRSADALVAASSGAQALRRFHDAGELLQRARVLEPGRRDLVLRAAILARADGDFPAMARAIRAYRLRGGRITTAELYMLRVGDVAMQRELANASPESYAAAAPADSFTFYSQKALLFLAIRNAARARALFDSSATPLRLLLAGSTLGPSGRRRYTEIAAWTDAARGVRARALAAATDIVRSPIAQQWPNGQLAAFTACNGAEIYAFLDVVELMLPQLRRCLTLPGGYATSAFFAEPALRRHANDPRVRALIADLELELGRTK